MNRFVLLAVVLIANPLALGHDKASKAETEWAKGVVTDYLKAARKDDWHQARQLLTAELRKGYEKNGFPAPRGYMLKWVFSRDQIAPDGNEVVLEGILSSRQGDKGLEFEFTVRVVKIKASGQWRIDYFLFEEK
jgi:hypothetical protein